VLIPGEAIFDSDVLTLDKACVFQTLTERGEELWGVVGRPGGEDPDHRHRRLLPSRALHLDREQQTAATEQCNELTPLAVEHRGLPPLCAIGPPTDPCAQPSAPPACRRTAGESLGQT